MTPATRTPSKAKKLPDVSAIAVLAQVHTDLPKADRREEGRLHTSAVLVHMLSRNGWSPPDLEKLAKWALNEDGALHTSQVSLLRNGKTRLMGMKCLDALGQINVAVWAYNQGARELLKKMGTAALTEQIEKLVANKEAIINPNTQLPIDQGDWLAIYLGLLTIPNVVNGPENDESWAATAAGFGDYIADELKKLGIEIPQAVAKLTDATGDADLAARLVMAAAAIKPYDTNELTATLPTICNALNALDKGKRTPPSVISSLR